MHITGNGEWSLKTVFDHLNYWRRRELRTMLCVADIPAQTTLMRQGEPGNSFVFLLKGSVDVTIGDEPVHRIGAGGFFGELALLPHISGSDGRRMATVTAEPGARLGVCGRREFESLLERFPRVGGEILAQAYRLTG